MKIDRNKKLTKRDYVKFLTYLATTYPLDSNVEIGYQFHNKPLVHEGTPCYGIATTGKDTAHIQVALVRDACLNLKCIAHEYRHLMQRHSAECKDIALEKHESDARLFGGMIVKKVYYHLD